MKFKNAGIRHDGSHQLLLHFHNPGNAAYGAVKLFVDCMLIGDSSDVVGLPRAISLIEEATHVREHDLFVSDFK